MTNDTVSPAEIDCSKSCAGTADGHRRIIFRLRLLGGTVADRQLRGPSMIRGRLRCHDAAVALAVRTQSTR